MVYFLFVWFMCFFCRVAFDAWNPQWKYSRPRRKSFYNKPPFLRTYFYQTLPEKCLLWWYDNRSNNKTRTNGHSNRMQKNVQQRANPPILFSPIHGGFHSRLPWAWGEDFDHIFFGYEFWETSPLSPGSGADFLQGRVHYHSRQTLGETGQSSYSARGLWVVKSSCGKKESCKILFLRIFAKYCHFLQGPRNYQRFGDVSEESTKCSTKLSSNF